MSTKDAIAQFNLTSPCNADWDSMFGNDRIRFCEHCQQSVNNLAEMNKKQLRRLLLRSGGRLCVRFVDPLNLTTQTRQTLFQIGRRTSVIAASAFSATLGFSAALAGSRDLNQRSAVRAAAVATARAADRPFGFDGGTIRGLVFDPNSAVITGASVTIINSESGEALVALTDGSGEYKFEGVKPGTYSLKIEARGFSPGASENIKLEANQDNRVDQTLSIAAVSAAVDILSGPSVTAGGIGMSSPTEPLVKAADQDDLTMVQQLLQQKPDANVRDQATDLTPLECAVRNANREMVQVLLWAKADVNARDASGQTVLMLLGPNITEELVWDLLNAGAQVNDRDNDGDTPLISAAQTNNVQVLKTLLDKGAKINVSNNDGRTALMLAASEGLVNNVRMLLLSGAQVDTRDKEGKTALMYAKQNDHYAVVRLLKSFGAMEFEQPAPDQ
jgi:ankyrin repeat protein